MKLSFKKAYFIYLGVLVVAMIVAIMNVKSLLHQYEDMRPEKLVEEAVTQLSEDATADSFFTKYGLSQITKEKFEEQKDVEKEYLALFASDNLTYSAIGEKSEEDTLYYAVLSNGRTIAEVKLSAAGPAVTKLAVLSFREWKLEAVTPVFEKKDYTILLPLDFSISANGVALTTEDGVITDTKGITYTVSGAYLEPEFEIKDQNGNTVAYKIDKNTVIAEFYDYSLTLPGSIMVHVNDVLVSGEKQENNRVYYSIRSLEKPEIVISDYYGNSVSYDGKAELPLTYMTVLADSRYSVKIDGNDIAKEAVTVSENKEYEQLKDYVATLPQISTFDISVLKKDAEVSITDENGNVVSYEAGKETYDFTTNQGMLAEVPSEISAEIDVLKIAQEWSLFMSNDKKFAELQKYLIKDSYQYNVAYQYATGVDITFMASHILANPAFTENSVTNFKWISDNCFSVDVYFIKHMLIRSGTQKVDDTTNDRFYFVKWDDTEDGIDNPTWKIASMREITNNDN